MSNVSWSVAVPVTSTSVTDYDEYNEEGLLEVVSEDVTLSVNQGLWHYLLKVSTFSV